MQLGTTRAYATKKHRERSRGSAVEGSLTNPGFSGVIELDPTLLWGDCHTRSFFTPHNVWAKVLGFGRHHANLQWKRIMFEVTESYERMARLTFSKPGVGVRRSKNKNVLTVNRCDFRR
jgi:hypothetical protein